jgi:hypothetical protein
MWAAKRSCPSDLVTLRTKRAAPEIFYPGGDWIMLLMQIVIALEEQA